MNPEKHKVLTVALIKLKDEAITAEDYALAAVLCTIVATREHSPEKEREFCGLAEAFTRSQVRRHEILCRAH